MSKKGQTEEREQTTATEGDCEETADGNYEVGYGKPPKHSRYKPGESGNSEGRPKGARNFKTDLAEILKAPSS